MAAGDGLWAVEDLFGGAWEMLVGHWPTFAVFASLLFGVALVARFLALTSESFGQAMGPIGKFFRDRQVILKGEVDDLHRRVSYLDEQVRDLRIRDELSWAWVMYDQQWHRVYELECVKHGIEVHPHMSFMEFREKWLSDNGHSGAVRSI